MSYPSWSALDSTCTDKKEFKNKYLEGCLAFQCSFIKYVKYTSSENDQGFIQELCNYLTILKKEACLSRERVVKFVTHKLHKKNELLSIHQSGVSSTIFKKRLGSTLYPGQNRDVRENLTNPIGCLEDWELVDLFFYRKSKGRIGVFNIH